MGILHVLKTVKYNENVIEVDDILLKKIQNCLMGMMKDIASVCEVNKIAWCLSGGSIIGAVRHQGFIPWDDDIDIFMKRSEYEKFKKIFEHELGDKYELKEPGDKGYLLHYPQIQKKGTKIKQIQSAGDEYDGLFIDIFIFENTYDNKIARYLHGVLCSALMFIDSALRMDACKANILKFSNYDNSVKKAIQSRARYACLFRFFSLEKWLSISDKCFSCINKEGKYVVAPGGGHHYFGEIFLKSEVCNHIKTKFETENWFIPKGYDYYLSTRYGRDYMKLPPVEDRERHVYAFIEID